jgi:hypothetical protein
VASVLPGWGVALRLNTRFMGPQPLKQFGYVSEAPELEPESEADEIAPELKRSRTCGAAWEQVIGSKTRRLFGGVCRWPNPRTLRRRAAVPAPIPAVLHRGKQNPAR